MSRPGNDKYRENYDRIFARQTENGRPCERCGRPLSLMPEGYKGRSPKCYNCGYQDMRK
jgi:exosome complex RNA-binding protein Csl4